MEKSKLLPCPFCGGRPLWLQTHILQAWWRVACRPENKCPIHPCTDAFTKPEAAAAAWNTRAPTSQGGTDGNP